MRCARAIGWTLAATGLAMASCSYAPQAVIRNESGAIPLPRLGTTRSRFWRWSIARRAVAAPWWWTSSPPATSSRSLPHNLAREARLVNDEATFYRPYSATWQHRAVNHGAGKYVRGDIHTNHRRLFQHLRARHEGNLPALRKEAPSPLSGGI